VLRVVDSHAEIHGASGDAADEGAFHADAGEFAAYEAEQLFGAGAQDAVDEGALRFARLAILRASTMDPHVTSTMRLPFPLTIAALLGTVAL